MAGTVGHLRMIYEDCTGYRNKGDEFQSHEYEDQKMHGSKVIVLTRPEPL